MEEKEKKSRSKALTALDGLISAVAGVISSALSGVGWALKEALILLPFFIVLCIVGTVFVPEQMKEAVNVLKSIFGG